LIENNFYSSLALLQVSEINTQLFDPQTILFKKLISFVLNDDSRFLQYSTKIAGILGVYLFSFVNHSNLLDYQITYLNRLVINTLKICSKHPLIFDYWLALDNPNGTVTSFPSTNHLPLFRIICNFLKYNKEYDQCGNLIKLMKLTNDSSSLSNWFYTHETLQELFELEFTSLYDEELSQEQRVNPGIKETFIKYLEMFNEIVEVSSSQLSEIYCQYFEENFLNIMLEGVLNSTMVSFMFIILKTLSNNGTSSILLERIISNKHLTSFLERIVEINYDLTSLLAIMNCLFRSHESTLKKLISGDFAQEHQISSFPSETVYNIEKKIMAIFTDPMIEIHKMMVNFSKFHGQSMRMYWFNSDMVLPQLYLSMYLDYFKNPPKLNIVLNELSSIIFLKVNVLGNQKFLLIIEYLYESYTRYLELLKHHEKHRFDSFEIAKLRLNQYFTPSLHLLQQLQFESYQISEELINFQHLKENLQLFKSYLADLYINVKFKNIDHAMS
ncbi:uncharacterized protein SPAPADRAFT_133460, partial [Spathaspora passalidarum NRRL Y-27907]